MSRATSIRAALVHAEEAARMAYEFNPGAYSYAALIAIRHALSLAGVQADGR
jgi:hypothetical protein